MRGKKAEYFSDVHRAQWKTKSGFILAAIGSAVGLGNIWRFSYLAYEYGGGAFLIPYFIALILVGIPLMILEFAIGHRQRGSAPKSFHKISPRIEWAGWWPVIFVMFGIVMYYSVIISWCVNYLFFSLNLSWGSDPNSFFFNEFLKISSGPGDISGINPRILAALLLVWGVNWGIVFVGVEKGIERASRILLPTLFILTLGLVGWSLTLPGSMSGIRSYLSPDFSVLADGRVWVAAFTQIFFTLSLGFGIMIAYASYLPKKFDIAGSAFTAAIADALYAVIAGFAVFGTLGYMATSQGIPIGEVVEESVGLAFVVYPQAISMIPVFPRIFGVLFFSILFFAGISSSVSIIEAFVSSVMDKFHFPRRHIVTVVSALGFMGSLLFVTGAGLYWLDIVDHFITTYGLVAVGIIQCLIAAWIVKTDVLVGHINSLSTIKVGRWWKWSIGFITPALLVFLFLSSLYTDLVSPYGGYSPLWLIIIGRDWVIATLIAAIIVSRMQWRNRKI